MNPFFKIGLSLVLLTQAGCMVKGYRGPELPPGELATISLKKPATSLIPLFWVIPFNFLNCFAEDWCETAWGAPIYFDEDDHNKTLIDRFTQVSVMPGLQRLHSTQPQVIASTQTDFERCSSSICSCVEIKSKKGDQEKTERQCTRQTHCVTPYHYWAHDYTCRLEFQANKGKHYWVFRRNGLLNMTDSQGIQAQQSSCSWGATYEYDDFERRSTTEPCRD